MHITILTIGSRGDVQPYVALGLGLQAAGHKVCLATHAIFENFVRSQGLDFAPLAGNLKELFATEEGQVIFSESGRNTIRFTRNFIGNFIGPIMEDLLADSWRACQGAEAIISMPLAIAGYHIAEKLGVPFYSAWTNPATQTRAFPIPWAPTGLRLGGTYNWLTYILFQQLVWQSIRSSVNQWRQKTLNLPPMPLTVPSWFYKSPTFYCYSPAVLPKPPDWPDWVYVTGYWFLDRPPDWQPSADLVDFLAAGSPPVYVTFGSIIDRNPEALAKLVLEAIALTGVRAILDTGWGGLSNPELSEQVLCVTSDSAPHDWLLPQMAAMVHHGGSGTTFAGLRAGLPSIIVPSFGETFFWGQRVADLGVGPPPIPKKQLTVERLADAIHTATSDKTMQARVAALSQQIRSEDGVARAVEGFQNSIAKNFSSTICSDAIN
ncbi:glycosyltransferase family 1 protein [Trichocoleus sp. FACHB-90]|uniref:glycosyltransferase n=1 Tax=Cyanophyceae TaxID=3028117 RepID=UPI001685CC38|nr:glycosyltransferase [Trichocoleus sp. FACHB-90]MBD1926377.1 glycosyltransferase family 1 protein [Trichocoleus sp. FACHB-90]